MKKIRFRTVCIFCVLMLSLLLSSCEDKKVIDEVYINADQYIELGLYKGLMLEEQPIHVTEKEIQQEMDKSLLYEKEVTGRGAKKHDMIYFDYDGTLLEDGEKVRDGGAELELGNGDFDPIFEKHLYGAKKGDKIDFTVTFSKDFEEPEYAGKKISFRVEINEVAEIVPQKLTDKAVQSVSDCKTVAEYKAQVKKEVYDAASYLQAEERNEKLLKQLVENSKWSKMNDQLYQIRYNQLKEAYEGYARVGEVTFDDIIKDIVPSGMSFDDYIKSVIKEELIIATIAEKEDLLISEKDYNKKAKAYIEWTGDDSTIDEYIEDVGKDYLDRELLKVEVMNFVYENANVVE